MIVRTAANFRQPIPGIVVALEPLVPAGPPARVRDYIRVAAPVSTEHVVPRRILVTDIQRAVCEHFGVTMIDLTSARRSKCIARPRQIAMYLSRHLTARSLAEIGRVFGDRDHTTVIHAVRTVETLIEVDPDVGDAVRAVRGALAGNATPGANDI